MSFRVSPGLPGSPPWSPRVPKWRHQACQMTGLGTKSDHIPLQKTVMGIKSNTFQQRNLENNYLETHIQKDNLFGPAPCQSCWSCLAKSASKPTSKPESQPASKPTSKLQVSKPATSKPAAVKGGRRQGRSLKIMAILLGLFYGSGSSWYFHERIFPATCGGWRPP